MMSSGWGKPKDVIRDFAKYIGLSAFFLFIRDVPDGVIQSESGGGLPKGALPPSPPLVRDWGTSVQQQLQDDRIRIRDKAIGKWSLDKAIGERTDFLLSRAELAFSSADFGSARKYVRQILLFNPTHPAALKLRSRILKHHGAGKFDRPFLESGTEKSARRIDAEKKAEIEALMERGEKWFRMKRYDEAVEEFEKVFALDPLNERASGRIDSIKENFIREKKKEWKLKVIQGHEEFSEKMEISIETARRLTAEKRFPEAKMMLNRLAFMEPHNMEIRKLMQKVAAGEKKAGAPRAA